MRYIFNETIKIFMEVDITKNRIRIYSAVCPYNKYAAIDNNVQVKTDR